MLGRGTAKSEELKVVVQEPKVQVTKVKAPEEKPLEVKPAPKPKATTSSPLKLVSLSNILNGVTEKQSEEQVEEKSESRIDPRSQELLEAARAAILSYIASWRPRFAVPFEGMQFVGNKVQVTVPTSELKVEIERSTSEILHRIVDIANIAGLIELELILDEKIVASRPVKLEDKIKYLVNINPEISKLKEKFNLYIE